MHVYSHISRHIICYMYMLQHLYSCQHCEILLRNAPAVPQNPLSVPLSNKVLKYCLFRVLLVLVNKCKFPTLVELGPLYKTG